ncbi:hypothetical protein SAMN04488591_3115 [Microbacterium azadirachtae]|uniref:Uncharacterized protein n=2 Tax=Microbacterium azadirachtae TaxID=582680 RepID=A0A1I6IYK1_9MICO|nr:hypothetical protein SAMN04488591_3115 [Microbacterium azadirachtae]
MSIAEPDSSLPELGLDGAGAEAELLTDEGEGGPEVFFRVCATTSEHFVSRPPRSPVNTSSTRRSHASPPRDMVAARPAATLYRRDNIPSMGRASRRKAERQPSQASRTNTDPPIAELHELMLAADRLYASVREFADAASRYFDGARLMQLPPLLASLSDVEEIRGELQDMRDARAIIQADIPVSGTSEHGIRWKTERSPRSIIWHAGHAAEGDPGYRRQLSNNREAEANFQRQQELEAATICGHGQGCRSRRVFWPGVDQQDSPACYRHLTPTASAVLADLYDSAVAKQECRGCLAAAGNPCKEEGRDIRAVDGRWPNIRSFKKRRVHQVRLSDFGRWLEDRAEMKNE